MECSVYGKGVRLTLLRRRLLYEKLTSLEREEIEKMIEDLEKELDII